MEAADRSASQPAASSTTAAASQRGVADDTERAHGASQPVATTAVPQSDHLSTEASFTIAIGGSSGGYTRATDDWLSTPGQNVWDFLK